jgi:Protein of unknown function (DUF1353)
MKKCLAGLLSFLVLAGGPISGTTGAEQGHFEGKVVVEPVEEAFVPTMRSLEDFGFRQAEGKLWKVERGQVFNGGGVPPLIRDNVGPLYESNLRKSIFVYEAATKNMTEDWLAAQRMFYEASLAEGVTANEAKVMYLLVAIQGSRWVQARSKSFCFGACHSPIVPLEWRPVADEARSGELVKWVRTHDPKLEDIDKLAQSAIISNGPHIFPRPACQRFSGSTLIRRECPPTAEN